MRVLGLLALAAIPPSVPFQTVLQAAPPSGDSAGPHVYLATSAKQLAAVAQLVPVPLRQRVSGVDFGKRAVLAVFSGSKPTSGYTVTIKKLTVAGPRLTVTATVANPPMGDMVTQVFTRPLPLLSLPPSALPPHPP